MPDAEIETHLCASQGKTANARMWRGGSGRIGHSETTRALTLTFQSPCRFSYAEGKESKASVPGGAGVGDAATGFRDRQTATL